MMKMRKKYWGDGDFRGFSLKEIYQQLCFDCVSIAIFSGIISGIFILLLFSFQPGDIVILRILYFLMIVVVVKVLIYFAISFVRANSQRLALRSKLSKEDINRPA